MPSPSPSPSHNPSSSLMSSPLPIPHLRPTRWTTLYISLLALRIFSALSGTGYVHPDEWFQNGEVVGGDLFDIPTVRTWEFSVSAPVRSMASIRLASLPLMGLAGVSKAAGAGGWVPSAHALFLCQRGTFLALSFLLDLSIPILLPSPSAHGRAHTTIRQTQCLLALSHGILALQVRPFSNALEAIVLAGCFVLCKWLADVVAVDTATATANADTNRARNESSQPQAANISRSHKWTWLFTSASLGALFSLGLFARFTFALFALPTGLQFLNLAWRFAQPSSSWQGRQIDGRMLRRSGRTIGLILPAAAVFLAVSAAHVLYDTAYYASKIGSPRSSYVIAPLNAAFYNLRSENLAIHGIHPRWLHAFVNLPMLLGLGPVLFGVWTSARWAVDVLSGGGSSGRTQGKEKEEKGTEKKDADERQSLAAREGPAQHQVDQLMRRVFLETILCALSLLSIQPHQEPRFLLPLVLPGSLLFADGLRRRTVKRRTGTGLDGVNGGTVHNASRRLDSGVRYALLTTYALQHLLLALFFGHLHQAGLLPALFQINQDLHQLAVLHDRIPDASSALWAGAGSIGDQDPHAHPSWHTPNSTEVLILFWRTFMPPRHLLLLPIAAPAPDPAPASSSTPASIAAGGPASASDSGSSSGDAAPPPPPFQATVHDLGSLPPVGVYSHLFRPIESADRDPNLNLDLDLNIDRLLVAPAWAISELEEELRLQGGTSQHAQEKQLRQLYTFSPHLDMDHISEMVKVSRERGLRAGTSLQVLSVPRPRPQAQLQG